jgi:chemotaxis protein CheX
MRTRTVTVTVQQGRSLQDGKHVDVLMIHALLDSLFTIFSTMVKLKITPGVPVPKQDTRARGDVSGVMAMLAEQASGSVALSLPLPAIRKISRCLLDDEIDCLGRDAEDLVGELTNMLVGGAKKVTAENGYDFDMQTPRLCVGTAHEITHHTAAGQTVLLPITMEDTEFYLELNFT